MSDHVPELDPDLIYEVCPRCEGRGNGFCMTCWDSGLVPHECDHSLVEWGESE